MVMQSLVYMLVKKIESGEINPVTGQSFSIEDIMVKEYRDEVSKILR
ncbi:hypothetical protein [Clostridium cylindrosporum]|uniref:Uncharacterized protein n=1 Tax=Clostridium cylindrosporum DSM 605 TaxID=1121307 RepID=A0A0J8G1V6_CLOCY|nr:hypothetical protein [Clostridium cylindrosporum]KMT21731.1 hypothetical protein CLCY_2c04950 [Clostridium cylindrosporum DSM 605]